MPLSKRLLLLFVMQLPDRMFDAQQKEFFSSSPEGFF